MQRISAWLPIAVLALAGGCGDDGPAARDASGADRAETRPASGARPAPAGLAEGEFVVSVVGGRVQLASRGAPRLAVLRRLADLEAFTLDTGELAPREVTLALEDASLAAAVAELLEDVSYRAVYEYDPLLGRNRLAALHVGGAPPSAPGRWVPARPPGAAPPRLPAEADREELDEQARRWLDALASPDDRERLEAAREAEAEGPGLSRLVEIVRSDPDPQVRAAALERLEDSGSHAAVAGILEALDDRDPRVVRAAISALEYAGDESVVPRLRPLLEHPDREVRAAAAEAIEFLE